jgi:hypothetical protein
VYASKKEATTAGIVTIEMEETETLKETATIFQRSGSKLNSRLNASMVVSVMLIYFPAYSALATKSC